MPETTQQRTSNGPQQNRQVHLTPPVDLFESEVELTLRIDLPGVNPDKIELNFEGGELTLRAEANSLAATPRYLVHEFETGLYQRVFRINENINSSKIEADYRQGELTVHLPKAETARPRQVRVKAAD